MYPFLYCGGTTSTQPDETVAYEGDSYGQVKYILEKHIETIKAAGGAAEDIYQVKMYATPDFDREAGLRAFGELFSEIKPIMTMVIIHELDRPEELVKIEVNAMKGSSKGAVWKGIKLERNNFSTGTPNEVKYGYSRVVKIGPFIYVGGTTSVQTDGIVAGEDDACEQNKRVYDRALEIMNQTGATVEDIVKIKKYVTEKYFTTWREEDAYKKIPRDKIVLSRAIVDRLLRPEQIVETEIFAILGCGGDKILPEWGELDFRKQVKLAKGGVWASLVKAGPFLVSGLKHSFDEEGAIIGAGEAEKQESFELMSLTEDMKELGFEPKDVVKLKAYYARDFKDLYHRNGTEYYKNVYEGLKPIYTGVVVSRVGSRHELCEIELTAIKAD